MIKKCLICLVFLSAVLQAAPRKQITLKVATYELSPQRAWENYNAAIAAAIVYTDADVIGIQGISNETGGRVEGKISLSDALGSFAGAGKYTVFVPSNVNPNYPLEGDLDKAAGIVWKTDKFEKLDWGIFWLNGLFDRPGRDRSLKYGNGHAAMAWVKLCEKSSGAVFVFASAFTNGASQYSNGQTVKYPEINTANCQNIIKILQEDIVSDNTPSIITLNSHNSTSSDGYKALCSSKWFDVYDLLNDQNLLPAEDVSQINTMNSVDEKKLQGGRPDHILVNGCDIKSYCVLRKKFPITDGTLHYPSTHFPVVSTISLSAQQSSGLSSEKPSSFKVGTYNMAKSENAPADCDILGIQGVCDSIWSNPSVFDVLEKGNDDLCVWEQMKHKSSGREFYFFCAHLPAPVRTEDGKLDYSDNKNCCKLLRARISETVPDGMPAILVGDMNLDIKDKTWGSLAVAMCMDVKLYMKDANRLSKNAEERCSDHIMLNGFRPLDYPSVQQPLAVNVEFKDYSDYGPATVSKGKKALRVMSFNMRYFNNHEDGINGWDHRKMSIPALLRDVQPDVFGTQEEGDIQMHFLDRQNPEYKHVGIFREATGKGECPSVYYRDDAIELLDWGGFWLSETPNVSSKGWDSSVKRTAVWTHMKSKATGKEFIFISTHLDHKGIEARRKGIDLILDTLKTLNPKKLPVMIVGDFNLQPDKPELERIKSEMKNARDCATSSDTRYSFNGFGKTWNGNIDYIWYKNVKKCTNFRVASKRYNHINYVSDHYPIWADFEL